jgi:hypothetical protein
MPNIDEETRDRTSPVWDMNQERVFIETLANQRFNYSLVFFSLVVAASVNARSTLQLRLVLTLGAVTAVLMTLAVVGAQMKLDIILDRLFKDPTNPVAIVDLAARAAKYPYLSVRRVIGFFLPGLFATTLFVGAIIAWVAPGVWLPSPPSSTSLSRSDLEAALAIKNDLSALRTDVSFIRGRLDSPQPVGARKP